MKITKYKMYDKKTKEYVGIRDLDANSERKMKAGYYNDAIFILHTPNKPRNQMPPFMRMFGM